MLGVLYRQVSMIFLCLELMSKSNGGLDMSDKRYWKVKGKKVNVTNKEHDTLRNSQKQMWRIINESAGQESLEDLQERDLLDSRLIIPGFFEPPVRILRAAIPENESHAFR